MSLFRLRGKLSKNTGIILTIGGLAFIMALWILLSWGEDPIVISYMLPKPSRVISAFGDLYSDNELIRNTCKSIGLNLSGYLEAILIAIPLGFLIGLLPIFRGAFKREVDAIRYVPLTALTGLFIVWFGVDTDMKVHFLAFGILIYLLPVVVQRIDEVNDVYLKTVYTLGATDWQTIRTVYFPSVMSRLSDDIRVLTAISWTYIIVAEGIGSTGGVGALIWRAGLRQGRVDKVFAILIIIILIGVVQDRLFILMDRALFPYKNKARDEYKLGKLESSNFFTLIWSFAAKLATWIIIGLYLLLFVDYIFPFIGDQSIIDYLFGDTALAIHIIMLTFSGFYLWKVAGKYLISKDQTVAA